MNNEKYNSLAEEVMNLARNVSAVNLRFLNSAISLLKFEQYEGSIGTDGEKLYYDPIFILKAYKSTKQLPPRLYLHSLLHCVFRHWFVGASTNHELWNLACDIAIEGMICELQIPSVSHPFEADLKAETEKLKEELKFLTAEKIYAHLRDGNFSESRLDELRKLFSYDDHSIWYSRNFAEVGLGNGNGDGSNINSKNLEFEYGYAESLVALWKGISESVQTDLETFSKQHGNNAGTFMQNLTAINRERYDYTEFLKKFAVMGEAMKINDDEFDYIFYTYGMQLYDRMPLIEPLEYKEVKRIREFAIVIDTSGSVQGELVQKFVQKTYNILKSEESFFTKINLHIIQCDAAIQEDVKITSQEEFDEYIANMKLHGFGGTDFRPAFSYVNSLVEIGEYKDLKGLIYFTDGYGDFPARQPDYNTAFVFIDDEYNNPDVPVWAIKLVLQKNEI